MATQLTQKSRFAERLAKKAHFDRLEVERGASKKVKEVEQAASYMYGMPHEKAVQTVQRQMRTIAELEGRIDIEVALRQEAEARVAYFEALLAELRGEQFFTERQDDYGIEDNARIDAVNETIGEMLGYEIPRKLFGGKLVINWVEGEERKILDELIRRAYQEIGDKVYTFGLFANLNADGISVQNNARKRLGINRHNWSAIVDAALNRA